MTLFESITVRRSVRKYDFAPLAEQTLLGITDAVQNAKRLYPGIRTDCEIIGGGSARGMFAIKAPYYLAVSSETADGYLTNVGFIYEQIDLYLSSRGIGSCWLGMAKPSVRLRSGLPFVIVMAFGRPADSPHRLPSEFNRKPLDKISVGSDPRLQYARLAPSATNSQPWFFVCEKEDIHIYRRNLGLLMKMYDKMNRIDIGIALCHLYVTSEQLGMGFYYNTHAAPASGPKDHQYVGSVLTEQP